MNIINLEIDGCFLITPKEFCDARGSFVKIFNADEYLEQEITLNMKEEFFSFSKENVLRGLHFQTPPYDHNKLVYCPMGRVLDFFCDLRKSSSTYGRCFSIELSEINNRALYLPKGIAHGFLSLQDNSLMIYKTDSVYNPDYDMGILWSSIDLDIGISSDDIIISERDMSFPKLSDYKSPF